MTTALALKEEKHKPATKMDAEEISRLAQLEDTIEENMKGFLIVGNALAEIAKNHLYRDTHPTFEAYVRERFELSRRRAYQQIEASGIFEIVKNFSQIGHSLDVPLPKNEAQVRALSALKTEEIPGAWIQAVESAPEGKITARHVRDTVKSIKGESIKQQVSKARKTVKDLPDVSPEFKAAFEVLLKRIDEASESGWSTESKQGLIARLQSLIAYIDAK